MKTKVLFVCNQNKLRSPTAETIFSQYANIEVDSAGLANTATKVLNKEQVTWADMIFVMDQNQMNRLKKKFYHDIQNRKIINLDIPDDYEYMDEALISLLKQRVTKFIIPKII